MHRALLPCQLACESALGPLALCCVGCAGFFYSFPTLQNFHLQNGKGTSSTDCVQMQPAPGIVAQLLHHLRSFMLHSSSKRPRKRAKSLRPTRQDFDPERSKPWRLRIFGQHGKVHANIATNQTSTPSAIYTTRAQCQMYVSW